MDVISPGKSLYNPTHEARWLAVTVRTFFSLFPFNSLMMEYYFQRQYFFLFFFLLCSGFLSSSSAYYFTADRKHGWGNDTSKNNQWAGEYRFQIDDTIVFKGSDSVLVVNETDYNNCNKANPEMKLDAGDSNMTGEFKFNTSGPFYFISGNNCEKKLTVVVLSPRNPPGNAPETRRAINPAILLVGSASLLLLVLLISNKKKKK